MSPNPRRSKTARYGNRMTTRVTDVRVNQKWSVHNTVLSWTVPDFEELGRGVVHFQTYEQADFKASFRILKTEDRLSLTVASPCIAPVGAAAEFQILDESGRAHVVREAQKLREGVYTALFDHSDYLSSGSGCLRRGILTAVFKYASDAYTWYREQFLENNATHETLRDVEDLCCDLKRMYLDAVYPDFEVHVGEYVFSTHKFVLMTRSDYFYDILNADGNMTHHSLDGYHFYPGIVHEVFLHVYSGELKELSVQCMLQVYRTANVLRVDSLCLQCLQYLEARTCVENYMDICKFTVVHDLTELEKVILRFARKDLPSVDIENVVAKLRKDVVEYDQGICENTQVPVKGCIKISRGIM